MAEKPSIAIKIMGVIAVRRLKPSPTLGPEGPKINMHHAMHNAPVIKPA
jgi:hypothetical protein